MLTVRLATEEDVVSIARRLREADLREIRAVGEVSPEGALMAGLRSPGPCYVAVDEEAPVLIFGTHPGPYAGLGFIWMMATDAIQKHGIQVIRQTRETIASLGRGYSLLANAVHVENTLHVRWIKWAGFTILREFTYNGNHFYEFAKITRNTHV